MKRAHKTKTSAQKELALERINVLFQQAKEQFNKKPYLSDRYVKLAREIAMKCKVKIPSVLKRRFCKHCHSYFVPSKNLRVRVQRGKAIYYCLNCKKYMRFPYRKRVQKKNRENKNEL